MKILDCLYAPWAIIPDRLLEIQAIYATHLRGEKIDVDAVEARIGRPLNNEPQGYTVQNGAALIPMRGVVSQRMNLMSQISGGVSTDLLVRDVRAAMEDPKVKSIVLMVDSPGGAVSGTQTAASAIAGMRGKKPMAAFAEGMMASAAYWIGSAADQIFIDSGTTQVGSIGVVASHVDVSKREEALGVKTTEIVAGKYKRISSQYGPLTEDGRAAMQDQVDYLYSLFVADVASNRGVSVEKVLADMADGRVFIGQQAIDAGLVDGVSTLDEVIAALNGRAAGGARSSVVSSQPFRGSSMTPQEQAAAFAAENAEAAAVLRAEGAAGERDRIAAVRAQSMTGHEALIEKLAADGVTSGPEAAVQVLAAERARVATAGRDRAEDAPAPVASSAEDSEASTVAAPQGRRVPAGFGVDAKAAETDAAARAYMAANPGVDYLSAVKAIQTN